MTNLLLLIANNKLGINSFITWPHKANAVSIGFCIGRNINEWDSVLLWKAKSESGTSCTDSGAEPSLTRDQGAEQLVQGRIGSGAVIRIRHSQVVTKQIHSSKTCPRASQGAELVGMGQGQNCRSRSLGVGITAARW